MFSHEVTQVDPRTHVRCRACIEQVRSAWRLGKVFATVAVAAWPREPQQEVKHSKAVAELCDRSGISSCAMQAGEAMMQR